MTTLTIDEQLLKLYTGATPPPILSDEELNAWADFYQMEPSLKDNVYFDLFIKSPREWCLKQGLIPRPHFNSSPVQEDSTLQKLLPEQFRIFYRESAKELTPTPRYFTH